MAASGIPEGLALPRKLMRLIDDGTWPSRGRLYSGSGAGRISADLVRALVPDETEIHLTAPPFWTLSQRNITTDSFWTDPRSALSQIDPERTVIIGDFGPGSDSPIALDYRTSLRDPSVIRLQWSDVDTKTKNRWVTITPTFDEFCRALKLRAGRPAPRVDREFAARAPSLSRKQQIYADILYRVLPEARNAQTWPAWRRLVHGNCYVELELVHNIPSLLAYAEMSEWDIHWLNTQARNYAAACEGSLRGACKEILSGIRDLVDKVPADLREKLQWQGPASSPKLAPLLSVPMPPPSSRKKSREDRSRQSGV